MTQLLFSHSPSAGLPATARHAYRLDAIDALRGIVMIIMALDHARDLLHFGAYTGDPTNLQTTTPALFLTRWITHFCAPVFVALSGTSIYLQSLRKTPAELSGFLLKRGLWLIVVEMVIVTFGITFDASFSLIILQVIWAIGISMILLALLIRLPFAVILSAGLFILLGHNALDSWEAGQGANLPVWYKLLHRPGVEPLGGGRMLGLFYPFLPWTGIMLLGYCFGRLYRKAGGDANHRGALITGLVLILLFIVLRWLNVYGDPLPRTPQGSTLYDLFSFINTQKYPPSLLYTCMTMGPALVLLSLLGRVRNQATRIAVVYGRVPFFYYVLHFYFLHSVSLALFITRHPFAEGAKGIPGFPFKFMIPGEGVRLLVVYVIWIAVVVALYPLCRWFGRYKATHKQWWLSYI